MAEEVIHPIPGIGTCGISKYNIFIQKAGFFLCFYINLSFLNKGEVLSFGFFRYSRKKPAAEAQLRILGAILAICPSHPLPCGDILRDFFNRIPQHWAE